MIIRLLVPCFIFMCFFLFIACMSSEEKTLRQTFDEYASARYTDDAMALYELTANDTHSFLELLREAAEFYYDSSLSEEDLLSIAHEADSSVNWDQVLVDSVFISGLNAKVFSNYVSGEPPVAITHFVRERIDLPWKVDNCDDIWDYYQGNMSDSDFQSFLNQTHRFPFVIENHIPDASIVDVRNMGGDSEIWGGNLLGRYQSISSGMQFSIQISDGDWDFAAWDDRGRMYISEGWFVDIRGGTWRVSESYRLEHSGESLVDPVPLGTWAINRNPSNNSVSLIRVIEILRGDMALQKLLDANMFTSPPTAGYEYLIVRLEVSYPIGEMNIEPLDTRWMQRKIVVNNQIFESRINLILEPTFSSISLLPGGRASGWLWFEIPSTGSSPVLLLGSSMFTDEGNYYLALGENEIVYPRGTDESFVIDNYGEDEGGFDYVDTIRPDVVESVGEASQVRRLRESDLESLSYREIKLVRNYSYACYDRPFGVRWIREFFEDNMPGYRGDGPDDPNLNAIERDNIRFIQEYESDNNIPVINN